MSLDNFPAAQNELDLGLPPSFDQIPAYAKAGLVFQYGKTINAANAGTDNPIILLDNPVGSGVDLFVFNARIGMAVSNNYVEAKLFRNPTVSANGTAQTTGNSNFGSSAVSAADLYALPTISAEGIEMVSAITGENGNSSDLLDNDMEVLEPGTKLLITGSPKSNNRPLSISIQWVELPTT